jgi:hypothetical protein
MTGRMQMLRQMFGWSTAVIFEVLRRTMRRQLAAAPKLR